jgi:hypothetical protein
MNYDPNSPARQKIFREAARYRTLRSIYGKEGLERIEIANGLASIETDRPAFDWRRTFEALAV